MSILLLWWFFSGSGWFLNQVVVAESEMPEKEFIFDNNKWVQHLLYYIENHVHQATLPKILE